MVRILADSACDLSQELIEKYNITIVPLHIHLGNEEYEDGINIDPDKIYKWAEENKTTPKTSVASVQEVIDVYEQFAGDEMICFSISQEMSSSGNVMRLAAEEMEIEEHVHIIDSRNLSTGIGLLIIEATIMAKSGYDAAEIEKRIESLIPKVKSSFVVDTLTYLHRGGRCSGVAALSGGLLHIHPKIVVADGKMEPSKKYRGKMAKVIMSYVKDMENDIKSARKERVFITHSGCNEIVIDEVYQYLKGLNYFDEILITRAGAVISSHCGPGTLGVLFISESPLE